MPKGFQEFQPLRPQVWRHLRECHRHHTKHFLHTLRVHLSSGSNMNRCFLCRWKTRKNKLTADEACLVGYCTKHSCCAHACLWMEDRLMMTERMKEQERATEERKDRARVRRAEGVMTRSAQDRGGDRGGSVSDRLLVAPLWRLWSSDPSRNLPYYKASPLHTGTTTKWSNYI